MFKKLIAILTTVVLLQVLVACTNSQSNKQIPDERRADSNVENSFSVNAKNNNQSGLALQSNGILSISKKALGKAFLLSPTIVIASNSPILDHMNPKVVSFEKSGNQLALLELNTSAVYDNLKSDKLLEVFEITSETADAISFKWSYGLTSIPLGDWTSGEASDFPESEENDGSAQAAIRAEKTFVRKMELQNNQLEIEQVSEVQANVVSLVGAIMKGTGEAPVEQKTVTIKLNVNIKPYSPNPNFAAKLSPFKRGIGAFEVAIVRKNDGAKDFYGINWDVSQGPITYAITKGTPDEMVLPISEGILYWNKVAGREIVKVVTGADPNSTPTERVVLVHWIPWEEAGFARASAQADPLTGEILRADVYLTSVFATGIGNRIRYEDIFSKHDTHSKKGIVASGFTRSHNCQFDITFNRSVVSADVKDPVMLKQAIEDEIRDVTAHEVGHTLGMRHNFAGSLHTEFTEQEQIPLAEQKYLKGQLNEGAEITSSVMDYIFASQGAMVGAYIKHSPLAYDQKFIEWFYTNQFDITKENVPPFCSDGLAYSNNPGCAVGDIGTNLIMNARDQVLSLKRRLATSVLHSVVGKMYPKNPNDRKTPIEITQELTERAPALIVNGLFKPLGLVKYLMSNEGHYFQIDQTLGKSSWLNEKSHFSVTSERVIEELESVGYPLGLISSIIPLEKYAPKKDWLKSEILALYQSPKFRSGKTIEGVPYQLTDEQYKFIGSLIDTYSAQIEDAAAAYMAELFTFNRTTPASTLRNNLLQEVWSSDIAAYGTSLVVQEGKTNKGFINNKPINLIEPAYSVETRKSALNLTSASNYGLYYPNRTFLLFAKAGVLNRVNNSLETKFNSAEEIKGHFSKATFDHNVLDWINDELAILKLIETKNTESIIN